ncbi:MAG: conjugal transfer protein TraN [Alphaproteobacteria bacterium]|nr:conjugal transfer protein TraN [Alphaproteobacteria bacterium]NCQ67124.1 conjugal transfer protein TraN [Alphaproteobacteria bacterium]NCT07721.1 conjugal transfer protein TraN [Alphaproteobacteria bacterium]
MNRFMALVAVLSVPFVSLANDELSYADGKGLGESLIQGPNALKTEDVPEYQGADVPETDYQENFHKMGDAATEMTHDPENQTGAAVINSQKERLEHDFRITEDDPLIQHSNEINRNPLSVIGGEAERKTGGTKEVVETTHVCEESAEEAIYTCDQTRSIELKDRDVAEYELNFWYRPQDFSPMLNMNIITDTALYGNQWNQGGSPRAKDMSGGVSNPFPSELRDRIISIKLKSALSNPCGGGSMSFDAKGNFYYRGGCGAGNHHRTHIGTAIISYHAPLTEEDMIERVEDGCASYEAISNQGLCRYGEEEIFEGAETREFCDGDDCISVARDWWKRQRTYHCKHPSKDNCGPFRSAGCEQTKANCKTRVGDFCVEHQKTFLCRSEKLGNGITKIGGDVPFCLDGNCDDRSWSANTDFAEAMSKMSVFREISKDMDAENATVFRGTGMKCSKSTMSFQDCCGSGGWGRSVGLGQNCSEDEKNLKKERDANKCIRVGTYCSQKEDVTKICLTKKTSFCCFGSKLAKIVHEQGRSQLGIGLGDAEHPDCRPFTVTELQNIDFSKIDLSELYSEIRAKTNIDNVAKAARNLGENWQSKIKAAKKENGKVKASDLHQTKEKSDVSL